MFVQVYFTGFKQDIKIRSFKEASDTYSKFRDLKSFGASDMLEESGYIFKDNKKIARVSFNAKVWDIDGALLFDPFIKE